MRWTIWFLFFGVMVMASFAKPDPPPQALDLKGQERSVRQPPDRKDKKGCCKIKFPAGGYDFFLSTEQNCRASLYFDRFLGENNNLCLRWEEN